MGEKKERIGKGVVVSTTYKKYKGKISVICILQISFTTHILMSATESLGNSLSELLLMQMEMAP